MLSLPVLSYISRREPDISRFLTKLKQQNLALSCLLWNNFFYFCLSNISRVFWVWSNCPYLQGNSSLTCSSISTTTTQKHGRRNILDFCDVAPLKLLKHASTRWLSFERCVGSFLQQWPALLSYFRSHESWNEGLFYVLRLLSWAAQPVKHNLSDGRHTGCHSPSWDESSASFFMPFADRGSTIWQ